MTPSERRIIAWLSHSPETRRYKMRKNARGVYDAQEFWAGRWWTQLWRSTTSAILMKLTGEGKIYRIDTQDSYVITTAEVRRQRRRWWRS